MQRAMRSGVFAVAALSLVGVPQLADQPYELKGESPGITLKQFKSNHRGAECFRQSAHGTHCRVYNRVSFGGIEALAAKGCTLIECSAQGIFANFVDDRLVYLMYGVSPGSSDVIIGSLKKKFGEPNEVGEYSATWRNSVGYLNVSETAVRAANGSIQRLATSIVSALNDQRGTKDI